MENFNQHPSRLANGQGSHFKQAERGFKARAFFTLMLGLAITLFMSLDASASHFKGGQINYQYMGNGMYKITVKGYWRANSGFNGFFDLVYSGNPTIHTPLEPTSSTILPDGITEELIEEQTVSWDSPGLYMVSVAESCCRIAGGANFGESDYQLSASINYDPANPSSSPTFYDIPVFNFRPNIPLNYSFNSVDPDGNEQVWTLSAPHDLTTAIYNNMPGFSVSSTGVVTWPNPTPGMWLVNVKVEEKINGHLTGAYIFRDFMLNITSTAVDNDPPVVDNIPPVSSAPGQPITFQVSASDPEGNDVIIQANGLPLSLGATFTQNNTGSNVTGTFTWNPSPADTGTYSMQFVATDNSLTPLSSQVNVPIVVTIIPEENDQTISFGPIADKTLDDSPISLSATASSGLPVSFALISGPATISGNSLELTGLGTVVVEATQEGDEDWNPAPAVRQTFQVVPVGMVSDGGQLQLPSGGTEAETCPGNALTSMVQVETSSTSPSDYVYVVTDEDNVLISASSSNMISFETVDPGNYRIWGLSYTGQINISPGQDMDTTSPLTTGEADLSDNFIAVHHDVANCGGTSLLPVEPIKECISVNADGSYTVAFGYNNPNTVPVTIPAGPTNRMSIMEDAGQPTTFAPGRRVGVFYVVFDGSPLTWTIGSRSVTVDSREKKCPSAIGEVEPIFNCVSQQGNGIWTASVSYNNPNSRPVAIPMGSLNTFNMGRDMGQPQLFPPGMSTEPFFVVFNGTTLRWTLGGQSATIDRNGPQCTVPAMPVEPILECVQDNGDGSFTAQYGYNNPNDYMVNTIVSGLNSFSGVKPNLGQPEDFHPGLQTAVFRINFPANETRTWRLGGLMAQASNDPALYCEDPITPKASLPIEPIFECITDNGNGTYTASVGYYNPNDYAITMATGPTNYFNVGENLGQPETFAPGRRVGAFYVVFDGSSLEWTIGTSTAETNSSEKPCAGPIQEVMPIVECVTDNADGTITAHFGYNNPNNRSVGIAPGAQNMLDIAGPQTQPVVFMTGRQENVFSVTEAGTEINWTLGNQMATATDDPSMACGATPMAQARKKKNSELLFESARATNIFPNPVANTLHLELPETVNEKVQVQVYSISGRYIQNMEVSFRNANSSSADMSGLAGGIYILKVIRAGQVEQFRIIKQ